MKDGVFYYLDSMTNKDSVPRPADRIWVSIIEDNHFVREAWITALAKAEELQLVGAYPRCEAAFRDKDFLSTDVALVDIELEGGMSGIEGVAQMKEHHPAIAPVMCTVFEDDQKIFDALCAGAVGYLLKEVEPEELVKAVRSAAHGGSPMTPNIARKVIASFHRPGNSEGTRETLTDRERDVLELLALGKSYSAIADELFLSLDGVGSRIRKIYEKLHAHTRAEAVAKGLAQRIIKPF